MKKEFPEVVEYARLTNIGAIINIKESNFREDKMYAANSAFLTMLPVKLIAGIDSTALNEPFNAVISETIAKKYFGDKDAIGQIFRIDKDAVFKISGIFKDIPSKYEFDLILEEIKTILIEKNPYAEELVKLINNPEDIVIKVIRWLLDHNKIVQNKDHKLSWDS